MIKNMMIGLWLSLLLASPLMGQFTIRGGGSGFSRSVSVSSENGVKTTRVTENGKKYVIRQGEDLIEVEFENTYGPNDMEKLKEKHPDLHMHVTSFPKSTQGSTVELTVAVKEKVKAENESELKEKNAKAFEIFEKFTKGGGRLRAVPFGRIDLGGIDLGARRIEIAPKIIELEKDAAKRMEEMKKKIEEMRGKARGPLFGKPVPEAKKDTKDGDEKAKKGKPAKPKKKDLIDI